MPDKYLKKILTSHVYDVARETPLELAPILSSRTGNRVWLKREDDQPVFSFKIRGAYNKMAGLPKAALKKGVIASSAGNHAQGVALAARTLKCKATIVMPKTTPEIKINSVKGFGGKVVLHGDNYDDAQDHAHRLEQEKGYTFIHPYDDPEVIAGQGTIGLEILNQCAGDLDAIFVRKSSASNRKTRTRWSSRWKKVSASSLTRSGFLPTVLPYARSARSHSTWYGNTWMT